MIDAMNEGAIYGGYWWWILPPGLFMAALSASFVLISSNK
ncbi:oligopeptide transport system permease protein appc, c-terminal fragment [Pyrococcus furiosus DSM 3638]|uniref:Oligopeptide transport system permease protein appc, c-terminal n=2 Tax=Pyrococcus furiosus TaxID=2261 RepID=Q8U251_PYRFU|nr:oligopeptide transport system permease protein appc, c-terminal fragment [Pyrococcus furiosus DSM 3638]AFN03794.1 dipeptide/oligopeptide ABC transporter permease [Pyrococcus furiosus COM1]